MTGRPRNSQSTLQRCAKPWPMYDDLQIGCLFWNLFCNAKSGPRSCHLNLNTQGSWASRRLRHCPNSGEQGQRLAWQLFGLFPGLPRVPSVWKASISEGKTLRREVRTKARCKVTEGPVLYSIVACMVSRMVFVDSKESFLPLPRES